MASFISCLCGLTAQEILLDSSTDHSILDLCHCASCRATTGLLCSSYRLLRARPQGFKNLCEYRQSENIHRYFCKSCGAHVFVHLINSDRYLVASGLFVSEPSQLKSIRHWQVGDTDDGGLSSFLPGELVTTRPGTCLFDAEQCAQKPTEPRVTPGSDSTNSHRLQVRCHCGGIEFYITPPDASSKDASSPWPDLLVPYHSRSSANTDDVKWWLQAGDTKYLAGTCTCGSCRLASGFPIQTWAFIPRSNIFNLDRPSTMQRYGSSPGVYREFCNRCGATVFWHCEARPRVIDVSVGLLRARTGARAEEWLEWATERVSFLEMAVDKALIQRLGSGLREWKQAQNQSLV